MVTCHKCFELKRLRHPYLFHGLRRYGGGVGADVDPNARKKAILSSSHSKKGLGLLFCHVSVKGAGEEGKLF